MKILGSNEVLSKLNKQELEAGYLFGSNDVLTGSSQEKKLYLHISNSLWSKFTGTLREYLLPWRWQSVYLDHSHETMDTRFSAGAQFERVLVNMPAKRNIYFQNLEDLAGKSLFITHLINENGYSEVACREQIHTVIPNNAKIPGAQEVRTIQWKKIPNRPLPQDRTTQHMYRIRGLYSFCMYHLKKHFSSSWNEVKVEAGGMTETVLVAKRTIISKFQDTNSDYITVTYFLQN